MTEVSEENESFHHPSSFSNKPPPDGFSPSSVTPSLIQWLEKRCGTDSQGNAGRVIYATGSTETVDKYKSKPVLYQPNMAAYLKGDVEHIYGSWLRYADGTTYVLSFDLDREEHYVLYRDYQVQLSERGVASICWLRGMNGRRRGHLELYFDRAVDADRAYAWVISMCPRLAEVTECFPVGDKRSNALSWPLYQRIGNQVCACIAVVQMQDGVIGTSMRERQELARSLPRTVISASQVEALCVQGENARQREARQEIAGQRRAVEQGNGAQIPDDLVRQVIADFNAMHSWQDVTAPWGGVSRGRFRNGDRGERTASCVIDTDEQYACDYGDLRGGLYPKKLDKYEVWVRANGIDKKADLDERCRRYRQEHS